MRKISWPAWLLAAVLVGGALPRLWLALYDDGLYWPDEIYQTLEPAHRLVFGYGMIAGEFVQGSRSWALPALIAAPLWLWKLLGGAEPHSYLVLIRLCYVAVAAATAWGAYRLARALGAAALPAVAGASLFSLAVPAIYFGTRALSETAAALPVVLGFSLALGPSEAPTQSRARRILGASLLGFSVLLRLQCGIFCAGLVLTLLLRRRVRAAAEAFCVLALWALVFGLLDKLTWGSWFHSAIVYWEYNAVEGKAAQWGISPGLYYLSVLGRCMAVPLGYLLFLTPLAVRRAPGLLLTAVSFVVLHSLVPHKELRFILPALPLFAALAAVGLHELIEVAAPRLPLLRPALPLAIVAACAVTGARFRNLTFHDLGQYETVKPGAPAYDDFGNLNRLLLDAHHLPDLCGLKLEGVDLVWAGGYSYLHRDVPLYQHDRPPGRAAGKFNYVIAVAGRAAGTKVAERWPYVLLRIGDGCVPDPGFSPLLR